MGVDRSEKEIELQFDGEQIVIKKKMSGKEFAEQKKSKQHDLKCFKYYNGLALCTVIYADFTDKTLVAENYTDFLVKTAFGQKKNHKLGRFYSVFGRTLRAASARGFARLSGSFGP